MKKKENEVRKKMIVLRMNAQEFERLEKLKNKTTEKYLSNYIRKVTLQKPVTIKYRNQTADDFLNDMIYLKRELNAIGNNYNQAVHKLHILEKIPEFRSWIIESEKLRKSFFKKVEEIHFQMNKLYEQWL